MPLSVVIGAYAISGRTDERFDATAPFWKRRKRVRLAFVPDIKRLLASTLSKQSLLSGSHFTSRIPDVRTRREARLISCRLTNLLTCEAFEPSVSSQLGLRLTLHNRELFNFERVVGMNAAHSKNRECAQERGITTDSRIPSMVNNSTRENPTRPPLRRQSSRELCAGHSYARRIQRGLSPVSTMTLSKWM